MMVTRLLKGLEYRNTNLYKAIRKSQRFNRILLYKIRQNQLLVSKNRIPKKKRIKKPAFPRGKAGLRVEQLFYLAIVNF